ncbi:MAG TPA: NAD+ synthase [Chloroflexota bacterium]|nr:NAD+ synthase [Chloroflexota bacterium]
MAIADPHPIPDGEEAAVASRLAINAASTELLLTGFVQNEVRKVGFQRVVVGLSGGIDSALSAFLAAKALGPENVLAIMMPYKTSSPESLGDAQAVVEKLGIQHRAVEITDMADAFIAQSGASTNKRKGNIMARTRMVVLYDQSEDFGALVLGTSNKTELLLGYGTLHGDMASAINPIGDLYKTQVWALSEHMGVPETIVNKPPTADLWVGQTDEGELGFTYGQVDELLFQLVDERYSEAELIGRGYESEFVHKVARLIAGSQFKRALPVIAKVSARTITREFRYPRDWGR